MASNHKSHFIIKICGLKMNQKFNIICNNYYYYYKCCRNEIEYFFEELL